MGAVRRYARCHRGAGRYAILFSRTPLHILHWKNIQKEMVIHMDYYRFKYEQLKKISDDIFKGFGFSQEEAEIITDVLITADLFGIESHGIQRLARYYNGIKSNSIHIHEKPEVVFETPVSATVDGHEGMGQLIAVECTKLAIEKAKKSGVGMVTVRNSNHFGIAGYYSKMATDRGLIGISMTNSESLMVPTNAKKAVLGSNPIAVSAPAHPIPFWFDAATVVVPRGKLEVYNKLSKPLHDGWAVDENGISCSDAAHVLEGISENTNGGILPLGGADEATGSHKGYGFGMICEIFTSILSGGPTSNHHAKTAGKGAGTSHFFMAIDPAIFGDPSAVQQRLSVLLEELRGAPVADGKLRIFTHGEKEQMAARKHLTEGIDVNINTLAEIKTIFDYLKIDSVPYIGDLDFTGTKKSIYEI